ncbi:Lrp/AsnC family transcriptional regulator [Streptomyces sp. SDr-06]|uniref:Lrp/AsnC family transcriptional regulator n=1 Tax=Streptomyces sp. SDr-06 TaxID=2267702 RepID=UPI000DEA2F97|nr:Lrp/AsnC family transcriptional regulator [Streptomyces sp. SDr-06]RCH59776.1 Lrp/AsnC family transcriptional regulator [Streptomyces sp. SDr-06]
MHADGLDRVDAQIMHALHLDGRVPFSRVAQVIGVSDQTVARRYSRLRASNTVRVWGLVDRTRLGHVEWLVRIRCTPDSAQTIAQSLARRSDTSWISRTSGGTELVCVTAAATPGDSLLLRELPRTARVLDVTAHCLLHVYSGRAAGVVAKLSALTPEQAAQLRPAEPPFTDLTHPVDLDDLDRHLLGLLRDDGRAPTARLAAETGASRSTVQRRIADLRAAGVLYFHVDARWSLLGLGVRTLLWLSVEPAHLERVGLALADHPEVTFVAATSGSSNLHAALATGDIPALYTYLSTRISTLRGVQSVDSAPVLQTFKGAAGLHGPANDT